MIPVRESKALSPGVNLAKTLLQMIVFWTTFLYGLPRGIIALERTFGVPGFDSGPWRGPAAVVFVAASSLGLWSAFAMALRGRGTPLPLDTASRLVVAGPYRYVRNPMAIAGLAQGFCVGLYVGSWSVLAYVGAGFVVWNWFVRPMEEADLEQRFGDEFRRYRAAVRCWIPRRGYH